MKMSNKSRAEKINDILEKIYPDAQCSLEYEGEPWKLLVMARLSAQCTDARVNIVSKELFEAFPTPESMANAQISQIEELVRSCGLYKTKAKSIKESCILLCEKFDSRVPDNMEDLLSLPGVGRKIANLILGDVFGKGGIVADTHCIRISGRLGFTDSKNPYIVERTLEPIVPKNKQSDFCHRLVLFGRDTCTARNPDCENCPLRSEKLCKYPEK